MANHPYQLAKKPVMIKLIQIDVMTEGNNGEGLP